MTVLQALKEKVKGDYNVSQANAVSQGLDGTPVVLIQVQPYKLVPAISSTACTGLVFWHLISNPCIHTYQ